MYNHNMNVSDTHVTNTHVTNVITRQNVCQAQHARKGIQRKINAKHDSGFLLCKHCDSKGITKEKIKKHD